GAFASTIAAHSALHIPFYAALASSSVVTASVIKSSASRVVPAAVVSCVVVMPIEPPMTPSPSKTAEPTDAKTDSEREVRTVKPNSGIRIPSRPRHDGISVNQPRIIRRDVNYIRRNGLNVDIRAFLPYGLLRRGLKSAGRF